MSDANCDRDEQEGQPDLDTMFELLADQRRRLALHHLVEEETGELDEIADAVCSSIESDPPEVAMTLHHTHLPKLDEAGIIEYDPRSAMARYYDHDLLEGILDWVAREDLSK